MRKALLLAVAPLLFLAACAGGPTTPGGVPLPPQITPDMLVASDPSNLSNTQVCEYSRAVDAWIVWLDGWGEFGSDVLGKEVDLNELIADLKAKNKVLKKIEDTREICHN